MKRLLCTVIGGCIMSRIHNAVRTLRANEGLRMTETHKNFMGGDGAPH